MTVQGVRRGRAAEHERDALLARRAGVWHRAVHPLPARGAPAAAPPAMSPSPTSTDAGLEAGGSMISSPASCSPCWTRPLWALVKLLSASTWKIQSSTVLEWITCCLALLMLW